MNSSFRFPLAAVLVALSAMYLTSCTTTTATSPPSSVNVLAGTPGTLSGFVTVVDANGLNRKSPAGVAVQIDGIGPAVFTDSNGAWRYDSVEIGTHTLTFFKIGLGATKVFNIIVLGAGIQFIPRQNLAEVPTTEIQIDSARSQSFADPNQNLIYTFSHTTKSILKGLYEVLEFALSPDSLQNDRLLVSPQLATLNGDPSQRTVAGQYATTFHAVGVRSGTTVYVALRSVASDDVLHLGTPSYYWDPSIDQAVYTARGPMSNIVSVVVP